MLMLLMCAGETTFALSSAHVVEIIPHINAQIIPHSADYLLGHINYGGKPVPVADLSILTHDSPSRNCMHTRIVLLQLAEQPEMLGLAAEKVTETASLNENSFKKLGMQASTLPFIEGILTEGDTSIHLIDVDKLFKFLHLGGTDAS